MNWLIENKEWVFSGIGGVIISLGLGFFAKKKNEGKNRQSINSGDNSLNIQSGNNTIIKKGENDVER